MVENSANMSSTGNHPEYWMTVALEQAKIAESKGDVPVGAVIVKNNALIAKAFNSNIVSCDPTAHAEIECMRAASKKLNNYRLIDCEIYVTLEPCMMCLGALLHARVKKLYFGATDPKTGSIGGLIDLSKIYLVNHQIDIIGNILSEECSRLLKDFFKAKR